MHQTPIRDTTPTPCLHWFMPSALGPHCHRSARKSRKGMPSLFPPSTSLFTRRQDTQAQDNTGTSPPPFIPTLAHSSSTHKQGAVPEGLPPPPFLHPRPHTDTRTGHANAGQCGTTQGQAPSCTCVNPHANRGMCRRIYPLPPCAPTPINV
jgi:hypothetical protein